MKFYVVNKNEIVAEASSVTEAKRLLNQLEEIDTDENGYEEGRYVITNDKMEEVNFYTFDDIYGYYTAAYPGLNEYILMWNNAKINDLKWNHKGEDILMYYEAWMIAEAGAYLNDGRRV